MPGSKLIFTNEHSDPRTYKVSFNRILTELKDFFRPQWNLVNGGEELVSFLRKLILLKKIFVEEKL